jgi:hypothetical protein
MICSSVNLLRFIVRPPEGPDSNSPWRKISVAGHLLEGIVSRSWQSWSSFCRGCLVSSCVGTTNNAGTAVAALPQATSEQMVSGAAIRAKTQKQPYWGKPNSVLRYEPTWGDADVLAKILTRLSPSNKNQLLAAFSSGSSSAKAIQLIRNCAAHDNSQTRAELQSLQSAYIVFPITHPTHALFWTDPGSGDFLITHAMQSLKDVGLVAIS